MSVYYFFVLQKQGPQPTPVKPVVKKENQWFDVGIVKVTNMVVTHFYVPADESQGDVSASGSFFSHFEAWMWFCSINTDLLFFDRTTLASCQITAR